MNEPYIRVYRTIEGIDTISIVDARTEIDLTHPDHNPTACMARELEAATGLEVVYWVDIVQSVTVSEREFLGIESPIPNGAITRGELNWDPRSTAAPRSPMALTGTRWYFDGNYKGDTLDMMKRTVRLRGGKVMGDLESATHYVRLEGRAPRPGMTNFTEDEFLNYIASIDATSQ